MSKGAQAIAVEAADYSKKSFEQGSATFEKLVGAKTLDKAIEIQTDYPEAAYESFVAQSTKMGELYSELAKEAFKPVERPPPLSPKSREVSELAHPSEALPRAGFLTRARHRPGRALRFAPDRGNGVVLPL